jgi:hypothetical protein
MNFCPKHFQFSSALMTTLAVFTAPLRKLLFIYGYVHRDYLHKCTFYHAFTIVPTCIEADLYVRHHHLTQLFEMPVPRQHETLYI